MSIPPITFSVEPEENGKLVYLPVAALSAGQPATSMIAFRLRIRNTDTQPRRLNQIQVTFPGQPGLNFEFERDLTFQPNQSLTTYLAANESIQLSANPPANIRIGLCFDGFTEPKVIQRPLAPHASPTPAGSYRFPGNTSDMGFNRYFSQKARHTGGSQHFAYDIGVVGWDAAKNKLRGEKPGTNGTQNEDAWGWGQPIYAMADGTVIRASSGLADNPQPGKRVVERRSDHTAGPVGELAITRLSDSRAASVVRTSQGSQKVIIWETSGLKAETVSRKGEATDEEAIQQVVVDALSGSMLVTAARTASGQLKLVVWQISSDANTVTRLGERLAGAVQLVTLARLSGTRFATAVRTGEGNLRLMVWEVRDAGQTIQMLSQASAGPVSSLSLVALSSTRLATAVRTAQGGLKVIVWDLLNDGQAIDRRGEITGEAIQDVALSVLSGSTLATALHLTDGKLRIVAFNVSDDGNTVARGPEDTAGNVQAVSTARIFDGSYVGAAVITAAGNFKLIIWEYETEPDKLTRIGENEAGAVSRVALDYLDGGVIATAVRTASGNLKLVLWWVGSGGGNSLVVLHGDELVLYAHFQKGSIPAAVAQPGTKVLAGQRVGRMGNSGSSSGPHLHIHAVQAPPGMTVEELISSDGSESLVDSQPYRPLPFHNAQAMQGSAVKPGILADNPFAPVNDQGLYFETMAVWPGMTSPGIPTGAAEIAFHGVRDEDYQALFNRVTGAGYRLVWFDGYANGTDLRFNVIFRPQGSIAWSAHHNLTGQSYQDVFNERKAAGFRLAHVNSYLFQNRVRYAAIFRKADGVTWTAYHGRSASNHQTEFNKLTDEGFVPVNVSVASVNGQRQYTALYEKRSVGSFILKSFLTRAQYQQQFDDNSKKGLQVAYIDAYRHNNAIRFSVIWNRANTGAMFAKHDLTSAAYQQHFDNQTSQGFLTRVVTGYVLNGSHRFAAVWTK